MVPKTRHEVGAMGFDRKTGGDPVAVAAAAAKEKDVPASARRGSYFGTYSEWRPSPEMLKNGGLGKRKAELARGGAGPWSKKQAAAAELKTGARGSKGRGSSKSKLESPVGDAVLWSERGT